LVCQLFFEHRIGAVEIAKRIRELRNVEIGREIVYPIAKEGVRRGFLTLLCPFEVSKANQIVEKYALSSVSNLVTEQQVQVVNIRGSMALDEVARRAATSAHSLILDIAKRKKGLGLDPVVHVAFASGRTTRLVAQYLAAEIKRHPEGMPRLVLHALSSGFSVDDPEAASVTFFSFFDHCPGKTSVGLFSQPFVATEEWDYTIATPGILESFRYAKDIDIVITSMAWEGDAHGEFMKFLKLTSRVDETPAGKTGDQRAKVWHEEQRKRFEELLRDLGWIGDVQYQPFSALGPIETDIGFRAVTLFTLSDLVALAKTPNKAVLLVCGPCAVCGESRAEALIPLLANPILRVWSHAIMDLRTAEQACWMDVQSLSLSSAGS
jgi:hypothetical protein